MTTQNFEISGKTYPVIYSYQALFWFANKIGISMEELGIHLSNGDMTEYEGFALLYSGIVAGCEKKNKRLDLSFYDFQDVVMNDEVLAESLGSLFQSQMKLVMDDLEAKNEKRSKKKAPAKP